MKSEKGMTLITTAILVVVIAVLVFAVIYYARIELAKESLEDLKTDMLLVQAKVKTIQGEYTLNNKEEELKGTKLSDMAENETIKNFLQEQNINPEEKDKKYYVFDKGALEELGLNKVIIAENSYYIVEYTTNDIYYTKGFTYSDGNTYYKLNDIENLSMDEE